MNDSFQKIFVSHVTGIEKTVLALPALRSLRHTFPHSHIAIATSRTAAEIIQLSGCADAIYPVTRSGELINPRASVQGIRALNSLRRERFDLALELHRTRESSLAKYFAQIGSPNKKRKLLAQIREFILKRVSTERHLAQIYLDIVSEYGAFPIDTAPKLFTDRQSDERFDARLHKSNVRSDEILIGIHPGNSRLQQRWAAEQFAIVAGKFIHTMNARVFIFAGPNERGLAKNIARKLPPKKSLTFESLPLTTLSSAFARLSVLIGNASGPAHLAAALGTPVVVAAPTSLSHNVELLSSNHLYVRQNRIENISPDEVFEAAFQLVKSNRAEFLWSR